MYMKKIIPSIGALSILALAANAHASTQTIQCHISDSGQPTAALVWQNTLGAERANRLCQDFSPRMAEEPSLIHMAQERQPQRPKFLDKTSRSYSSAQSAVKPSSAAKKEWHPKIQEALNANAAQSNQPKVSSWEVAIPPGYLSLQDPAWDSKKVEPVALSALPMEALMPLEPIAESEPATVFQSAHDTPAPSTKAVSLTLQGGTSIAEQVRQWAEAAGWKLVWNASNQWITSSTVDMQTSDMLDAVDKLGGWLQEEGRPIRFTAYEGNKVLVADSLEAMRNQ